MGLSREVDRRPTALPGSLDGGGVSDVPTDHVDVDTLEVPWIPGVRHLVEHDDVVAGSDEALHEVASDEAAAAGDKNAHPSMVIGEPGARLERISCGDGERAP